MAFMINLREQFASRFADIRSHGDDFKLFGTPFSTQVEEVPENIENELFDLQSDHLMKEIYTNLMTSKRPKDECLIEFYKMYLQNSDNYPNIMEHARKMACIFGSTYVCEQLFSKMKFIKNKLRTLLNDVNLNSTLRLASSSFKADIDKLSREKHNQPSH